MNLRTAGSSTARSADTLDRRRRSLAPLVTVTVAALVFAILLILVRLQWAPLESADHGAAADINSLIAGNATLVAVVKAITWLGSNGVLWMVIGAATVILAIRQAMAARGLPARHRRGRAGPGSRSSNRSSAGCGRWWRIRSPTAPGTASPAGTHSARSSATERYFSSSCPPPAAGGAPSFITVIVALIALIGISRILLGVHYLSDVVGAWAIGITWLGVTAFAFELTRQRGRPAGDRPGDRRTGARGPRRSQAGPAEPAAGSLRRPIRPHRRRGRGGLGADRWASSSASAN